MYAHYLIIYLEKECVSYVLGSTIQHVSEELRMSVCARACVHKAINTYCC